MKVSNQFKIIDGANRFAILRSVMDTEIKNLQNPLSAFSAIATMPAEYILSFKVSKYLYSDLLVFGVLLKKHQTS